jgi:putative hydrolase of the HAD superfamily
VSESRATVLDFGNVVAFFSHAQAAKNLAELAETTVNPLRIQDFCFGSPLDHAYERGQVETADFRHKVKSEFNISKSDQEFDRAFADIFQINPAVEGWLGRLKREGPLLLLSNTTPLHSDWFLRQFAPSLRHFDHVVLSNAVGHRKPEAEVFRHCQKLAGLPAGRMVLVDDLADNIAGAQSQGWRGVLYHPGVGLDQVLGA